MDLQIPSAAVPSVWKEQKVPGRYVIRHPALGFCSFFGRRSQDQSEGLKVSQDGQQLGRLNGEGPMTSVTDADHCWPGSSRDICFALASPRFTYRIAASALHWSIFSQLPPPTESHLPRSALQKLRHSTPRELTTRQVRPPFFPLSTCPLGLRRLPRRQRPARTCFRHLLFCIFPESRFFRSS